MAMVSLYELLCWTRDWSRGPKTITTLQGRRLQSPIEPCIEQGLNLAIARWSLKLKGTGSFSPVQMVDGLSLSISMASSMDSDAESATKVAAPNRWTFIIHGDGKLVWTFVLNPRLKSRPQDNYNSSGAATLVAGRVLHRAMAKFSHWEMKSEAQRNRKLQSCTDGRWTFAFHFDGEFYGFRRRTRDWSRSPR
jgi:hypothetical protein